MSINSHKGISLCTSVSCRVEFGVINGVLYRLSSEVDSEKNQNLRGFILPSSTSAFLSEILWGLNIAAHKALSWTGFRLRLFDTDSRDINVNFICQNATMAGSKVAWFLSVSWKAHLWQLKLTRKPCCCCCYCFFLNLDFSGFKMKWLYSMIQVNSSVMIHTAELWIKAVSFVKKLS